jgi:hypothetical protein
MDGGIMSGLDVLRALACGADAVLVGRAFMLGLAALGSDGARHVANTLTEELQIALAQTGACDLAGVAKLAVRHRSVWHPADFETASDPSHLRTHSMSSGSAPSRPRLDGVSSEGGEGSDPAKARELNG